MDGRIVGTPDRDRCWAAQTPQVVRKEWLIEAMRVAKGENRTATDDAQLIEWQGRSVAIVEAKYPNPKITHPEDLLFAEALLAAAGEMTAEK